MYNATTSALAHLIMDHEAASFLSTAKGGEFECGSVTNASTQETLLSAGQYNYTIFRNFERP